jgi:hypothetical protein
MRADIAPGGTFPDYELTDHTKTGRRLSYFDGRAITGAETRSPQHRLQTPS